MRQRRCGVISMGNVIAMNDVSMSGGSMGDVSPGGVIAMGGVVSMASQSVTQKRTGSVICLS